MTKLTVILEILAILFLCAAGIGGAHLWKTAPLTLSDFGVMLILPAMASTIMFCVYCVVPDLLPKGRIGFPAMLTLPLLFSTLLFVLLILFTRLGVGITKLPDALQPIRVWGSPWVIAVNLITGCLALSAVAALSKERNGER